MPRNPSRCPSVSRFCEEQTLSSACRRCGQAWRRPSWSPVADPGPTRCQQRRDHCRRARPRRCYGHDGTDDRRRPHAPHHDGDGSRRGNPPAARCRQASTRCRSPLFPPASTGCSVTRLQEPGLHLDRPHDRRRRQFRRFAGTVRSPWHVRPDVAPTAAASTPCVLPTPWTVTRTRPGQRGALLGHPRRRRSNGRSLGSCRP